MSERIIAIGDVHGCLVALHALLEVVDPRPGDTIVTLGDYVDRGPDSRGVIEQLIALSEHCRLIPILGNHDQVMLDVCDGADDVREDWSLFGGDATAASYDGAVPERVPREHLAFLRGCVLYHETSTHFFVHGLYEADLPLASQSSEVLLWDTLRYREPGPHMSGKTAIVGHTAQPDGEILDLGYLKCIDTCCYGEGWLTALDVASGQVWQADKEGRMRRGNAN